MEAFLLLDEQNLKDIGVSTMGARKKIYNAILSKLIKRGKQLPYFIHRNFWISYIVSAILLNLIEW